MDLGLDLVALGDGHLAHVVAESGDLRASRIVPGTCGSCPDAQLLLHSLLLPVADDDLAITPQTRADEPELAIAVGALVEVHEVHVDVGPRDVPIELRVQVHEGLVQRGQAGDPHLGRRERVHPGDDADAVGGGVGLHADVMDGLRRGHDRLEDDLDRDLLGTGKPLRDLSGVLIHLLEGLGAIKVLASRHKPQFQFLQVGIHKIRSGYVHST